MTIKDALKCFREETNLCAREFLFDGFGANGTAIFIVLFDGGFIKIDYGSEVIAGLCGVEHTLQLDVAVKNLMYNLEGYTSEYLSEMHYE